MTVISMVNMKGGVAKTTLGVNLAHDLAERHSFSVLLIDTDPQFNATQCLVAGDDYINFLSEGKHTVLDIFDDSSRPIANAVRGSAIQSPSELSDIEPWQIRDNLDLVAGNLELHRLDMTAGSGREFLLKRYLEEIEADKVYDFVIIDTPPTPSAWMVSALLASDYYIVPLKPEPLSRRGIDLLRGVVDRSARNFGHRVKNAGVVLTLVETNTIVYRETVDFLDKDPYWKGRRFKSYLPKKTLIARSQADQQLILDLNDDDAKRSLAGISNELLHRLEQE